MWTFVTMVVNIGEKVRLRAKQLRVGPTELGKLIDTSKQNVYGIYKRKSLDAELLRKLCTALEYDFFEYYRMPDETAKLILDPVTKYDKTNQKYILLNDYQKLKADYDNLKEKFELLKRVNELLEKRAK